MPPRASDLVPWVTRFGPYGFNEELRTPMDKLKGESLGELVLRLESIKRRLQPDASYKMPAAASPDDMVQTAFSILKEFIESPPSHPYHEAANISLALESVKHICEVRTALALAERDEAAAQRAHVERLLSLDQIERLPWYTPPEVDIDEGDVGAFLTQLSYGLPDLSQSDGLPEPGETPCRVKREDPCSGSGRRVKRRRDVDGDGAQDRGVGASSPCVGLRVREGDAEGNARERGRDHSALPSPMPDTPTLRGRSTPATPFVVRRAVFPGSGGIDEGREEGVLVEREGTV